jgi:hypothetical protein
VTEEPAPDAEGRSHGTAAVVTLVGAVAAAAISLTTLLFTLFPEWRPDPRERSDATIAVLALDRNVTQQEFLGRVGRASPTGCEAEQLARSGNVVYIQVDIAGFKSSSIRLHWFTYDAGNGRRTRGLRSNDQETTVFQPRAPINRQVATVWVPTALPSVDSQYFIRFELYSAKVLRAFVDTITFDVPARLPDEYTGDWCQVTNTSTNVNGRP